MRPLITPVTRKTILMAVFVFALAASVGAAPQRGGGGGHSGGGQAGGGQAGGGHGGRGHVGGGRQSGGGGRHGHVDGRPRGHGGGPRGHFHGPHIIIGGGFYDPFWGSYYPHRYGYTYGYPYGYPYWPYDDSLTLTGNVKTDVTPKQAEVYVDGYYAGVADDFDGTFQQLHTSPGGHAVTLRLEGYRTVTQNIYVRPNSTYKLTLTMAMLAPGEVDEPVPGPTLPTGRPDRVPPPPDGGSAPPR